MKIRKKLSAISLSIAMTAVALQPTTAFALSDSNGDGVRNTADAVYISLYLEGKSEPVNLSALDFDGNGVISQMDYKSVMLYVLGIWEG